MIHPERLSDETSNDRESLKANRMMRQSDLRGNRNPERRDRSVPPADAGGIGQKVTGMAVVRSYKEPLMYSGIGERSSMKTPNNGETLENDSRQSRGGNQTNSARETDKEHLVFEMVIQSVPMCEHGSAAEMTAPFASRRVTTKCTTPINVLRLFEEWPIVVKPTNEKPLLIDLDAVMQTGGKDRHAIHPDRLSEAEPLGVMRQSELTGMLNRERETRRSLSADGNDSLGSNKMAPANDIELFQRPIGQNLADGVTLKTLLHTNMRESCAL